MLEAYAGAILDLLKSIPRYISTKERSYFCVGVNHEEDATKEKQRPLRSLRPRRSNCVPQCYMPRIRLGASLERYVTGTPITRWNITDTRWL